MKTIVHNDFILIVYKDKRYLKRVDTDRAFHGKGGILTFNELIGKSYGIRVGQYEVYEPTLEDLIMYGVRRETQIVYPKDGAYICCKLNAKNGSRIMEIGAGSGAMTLLFSRATGPQGFVISFEKEERHFANAKRNIERFLEWNNVHLFHGDGTEYNGGEVDAAFIDVREPWLSVDTVRRHLKKSGMLGMIVPTTNQITECLKSLDGFGDIEVLEILLRKYKTIAERVRPEDRMVAHTGYLIFGRKLDGYSTPVTK